MMKLLKILLISSAVALMVATITYLLHPRIFHSGYRYLRGRITHCGDYPQQDYSKSLNDRLTSYIDTSRKLGIQESRDESELMTMVQAGELEQGFVAQQIGALIELQAALEQLRAVGSHPETAPVAGGTM